MRLLIDVSAGWEVADAARAMSHDTAFVRERDPSLPDEDILAWGLRERRVVVTLDKDFGDLVARDDLPHAGVLLIRIKGARTTDKVAALSAVVSTYADQLPDRFAVYQGGRVRFH